jgi:3'-phosphoadenosine 5'-phosphosulfate sulfotransferase (PAPS reductase)/FAD synthetase
MTGSEHLARSAGARNGGFVDDGQPERLIAEAKRRYSPIATVCLFSGGHDSTVLAHRCQDHYDQLCFVDTGTAVPGVVEHVERTAAWLGKPVVIMQAGDAYRRMVLGGERRDGSWERGHGFPGPGMHSKAYTRLKERQIEALLKRLKVGKHRHAKVLFLSGVRRDESARRANREPITKHRGKVFCNPLIDWTNAEMRAYRAAHALPESDVAALLHRSGECNCGCYAKAGEREELRSLWPNWFEVTIGGLEREAEAAGIQRCRWGAGGPATAEEAGPMCTDCQLRFDLVGEAEAERDAA